MPREEQMMHGRHWRGQDVRGWLCSEKLDGCRAWWDGTDMWSRSGRRFAIPDEWRAALPAMVLEGEIWGGRGGFEKTVAAVVRNRWAADVCFLIFDAPGVDGAWDKRMAAVKKRVRCAFAAAVPWERIKDVRHLARMFRRVGESGGEGLMLRCPSTASYSPGRSDQLLKLTRDPLNGFVPPGRLVVERRMRIAPRAA